MDTLRNCNIAAVIACFRVERELSSMLINLRLPFLFPFCKLSKIHRLNFRI